MAGSGGGACVQWGRAQSRERHRNEQRERRKRAGLISLSPPPAPPPPSAPLPPPAPVPCATEAPAPLRTLLVAEDHQLVEDVGVGGLWSCWWPPAAQHLPSRPTGGRERPTRARSVAGWLAVGGADERAGQLWCWGTQWHQALHLGVDAIRFIPSIPAQTSGLLAAPSEPAEIEPAERESDCLLAAGSSSNGAREAREWIERRGGPTSDSLQLRACIRARPMECRDRETSNRPCWRLLSLAELDNRW